MKKMEKPAQGKSRYSKYLSFDKQAIRTKSFRKISLLDVPCPQNFIPGVNRGELVTRSSTTKVPARRISSVCYQGILINTRGTPSETKRGLLQAGLVALTFPAPSQHVTCVEHTETRPRRAMTQMANSKEPVTVSEKIDQAISLSSHKHERRYTVPLLLDPTNVPPSLVELFEFYSDEMTNEGDEMTKDDSHTVGQENNQNSSDTYDDETQFSYIQNYSSLPDIYTMSNGLTDHGNVNQNSSHTSSVESESGDLDHNKNMDQKNIGIRVSRVSVKTLPKNTLNSLSYTDTIIVPGSPLSKVRMACKPHYATKSIRELILRHGTLICPGSGELRSNQDVKRKQTKEDTNPKISDFAAKENMAREQTHFSKGNNSSGERMSKSPTIGDAVRDERPKSPQNVVSRAISKSLSRTTNEKGNKHVNNSLGASIGSIASLKKVSSLAPIEVPRSREEKETFNQIQDVMRSKLPKTFRTTVRMGLFTDPVNLQETNSRKEGNIASKLRRKTHGQRSFSLTPNEEENHERWKRRSNTNPDIDVPLELCDQEPVEKNRIHGQCRTFPRIGNDEKEVKRFDLFSIFRPRHSKKSETSNTDDALRSDSSKRDADPLSANGKVKSHERVRKVASTEGIKGSKKLELQQTRSLDATSHSKTVPRRRPPLMQDNGRAIHIDNFLFHEVKNDKEFVAVNNTLKCTNTSDYVNKENMKNTDPKQNVKDEEINKNNDPTNENIEKEEEELNQLMKELEGYIEEMEGLR